MGNIKNFNFNNLDLKLSKSDYWDFYLANDDKGGDCSPLLAGSCEVVWYDFNNTNIFENNTEETIYSLVYWTGATNHGYTLDSFGLTGIDNGAITFNKLSGDTSNTALLSALTQSTLTIPSGDTRLALTRVTGSTSGLTYDYSYVTGEEAGNYMRFLGGFYQGYYKLDGTTYEVLPTRVENSWSAELWLKPETIGTAGTTLNDLYPNNKGFFFYMGTRAENKFWDKWVGADTGCTSGCTSTGCTSGDTVSEWCTVPKETDMFIIGDYGVAISLTPPRVDIDLIKNGFLIYGNGSGAADSRISGDTGTIINENNAHFIDNPNCNCGYCKGPHDGLGSKQAWNYDGKGISVKRTRQIRTNYQNPFLIYGRGSGESHNYNGFCMGPGDGLGSETSYTFTGETMDEKTIDYKIDIVDNAIGFRIKDDGSIGYRLLTVTGGCQTINGKEIYVSGVTIEESYSQPNVVIFNTWNYIVVKFVTDYKKGCDLSTSHRRKGKLMFYVNGKLKHIVDEFDEFIAKRLDEYKDKQLGVPFNFSLGGGSQGLIENQTFGGLDNSDRGLPIETNFAGSFIGSISQFKFNICELKYCNIINNYNDGIVRYNLLDTDFIVTNNWEILNTQDGDNILWT